MRALSTVNEHRFRVIYRHVESVHRCGARRYWNKSLTQRHQSRHLPSKKANLLNGSLQLSHQTVELVGKGRRKKIE